MAGPENNKQPAAANSTPAPTPAPTAAPASTPAPTPDPAASPTKIQVGTETFELNHITAADAARLYTALGTVQAKSKTDYQKLARDVSAVCVNYQSIIALDTPAGEDPAKYIAKMIDDVRTKGAEKLDAAGQKFYAQFKSFLPKGATDSSDSILDALGAFGSLISGVGKGIMLPKNLLSTVPAALIHDGKNTLDGKFNPISKEAADSIGTVYAAAIYNVVDSPNAPAATQVGKADWFDSILAYGEGAWDWVWRSGIGKYISAFINAVSARFFSDGPAKDWSTCWHEGLAAAEQDRAKEPKLTHQQRIDQNMVAKIQTDAHALASGMLEKVEDVAGVSGKTTKDVFGLVQKGGTMRDNNGHIEVVTPGKGGAPKIDIPVDPKTNKPISANTATNEAVAGVTPDVNHPKSSIAGMGLGVAGDAVAGGYVAKHLAIGFGKQLVGKNSNLRQMGNVLTKEAGVLTKEAGALAAGKTNKILWWIKTGTQAPDPVAAAEKTADAAKKTAEAAKFYAQADARDLGMGSKTLGKKTLVELADMEVTGWSRVNPLNWPKMFIQGTGRNAAAIVDISSPAKLFGWAGWAGKINPLNWPKLIAGSEIGTTKILPIVGEGLMATSDVVNAYQGAHAGDDSKVHHSLARAGTGLPVSIAVGRAMPSVIEALLPAAAKGFTKGGSLWGRFACAVVSTGVAWASYEATAKGADAAVDYYEKPTSPKDPKQASATPEAPIPVDHMMEPILHKKIVEHTERTQKAQTDSHEIVKTTPKMHVKSVTMGAVVNAVTPKLHPPTVVSTKDFAASNAHLT